MSTEPLIPVALVDALLSAVAGHLHDHPVQSLVAAKLMVESTQPADDAAAAMRDRGVHALTRAATQSRDVMWALERAVDTPADLAGWRTHLSEHLQRAGGDEGVSVTISSADEAIDPTTAGRLAVAQAAILDVAAALMLGDGALHHVDLIVEADAVRARVTGEGDPEAGAGAALIALARARAGQLTISHRELDGHQLTSTSVHVV